ncbi:MAG: efflux RND transporter periplasmic adaptor subunit [Planctomycetota bacterium]|nr:MAG: efflux RND transporter periplasmic adaptor subunit [Planctomycetota bacterium]
MRSHHLLCSASLLAVLILAPHLVLASEPTRTLSAPLVQWPDTARVVGTVASAQHSHISPRVSGVIVELPVRLGDTVAAGDVLARLEAEEIHARLAEAEAQVALANADLARVEQLIASGTASVANADSVRAAAAQAKAALHAAQTMVGYLTIRAPYDGVITARHSEAGDIGQPGTTILEIADPRRLRFEARVPETLVNALDLEDTVSVVIADVVMVAPIVEIAAAADPQSRSVMVKACLEHDEDRPTVRIGQFGRMHITTDMRSVVAIPASAIIQRGQLQQVAVIEDDTVRLRLVRTGRLWQYGPLRLSPDDQDGATHTDEAWLEIVAGLSHAEQLILSHPQRWRDGQAWQGGQP